MTSDSTRGNEAAEGFRRAFDRLERIAGSEADWDSYGAPAISELSLAMASSFIGAARELTPLIYGRAAPFFVVPSPDGGVQVDRRVTFTCKQNLTI
jgi:hypothetical protein